MKRKDISIASALCASKPFIGDTDKRTQWLKCCGTIAMYSRSTDAKFNTQKFLKICGLTDAENESTMLYI